MARDLEQMTDLGFVDAINFYVGSWSLPTVQSMPGLTNALNTRTNFQQELFFTSRFNKEASGLGYRVVPGIGVGSLYRFVTNVPITSLPTNYPSRNYFQFANTNQPQLFQRVTDGVVHFRVTAFDSQGRAIEPYAPRVNPYWTNVYANLWVTNELHATLPRYLFTNAAVPAVLRKANLDPAAVAAAAQATQPVAVLCGAFGGGAVAFMEGLNRLRHPHPSEGGLVFNLVILGIAAFFEIVVAFRVALKDGKVNLTVKAEGDK